MSLRDVSCPGCTYSGVSHLEGCPNSVMNRSIELPPLNGPVPGVDVPHFVTGTTVVKEKRYVTEEQHNTPVPEPEVIMQTIVPSTGTKLVCTSCGRADWHTLVLRRRAGYLEGLCKQMDGSGCYPLASRRGCGYTYPEGFECPKLAEYCVATGEEEHRTRQVCRDHVGELLRNAPLYQVWPLED